ncbi:hypothetical protein BGX38DRAFT_1144545 [Terfezia claveryi]|nr:hypothetical protein BGX38DRAFT_1144545 [Terfezia claveryi]
MTTPKCEQTGHFFGYLPEHDIGFTCFECLEEFGSSGRRPWVYSSGGMARDSRKRRSLHLPQDVPQEPAVVSEKDDHGRRRSKPWRCLQTRCKLLACDRCAELLIDPAYVSSAKDRDLSRLQGKRNSIVGCEVTVRAGAATPPEHRKSREIRGSMYESLLAPVVQPIAVPAGGTLDCDSESDHERSGVDFLRAKLVYRRAGHAATSALAHLHRDNRPGRPSKPNPIPAQEPQEARRTATAIPEHLISTTGLRNQMITLEVDSKEGSDDDMDFMPRLDVRSAAQAATQAMMAVPWRQRASMTGR